MPDNHTLTPEQIIANAISDALQHDIRQLDYDDCWGDEEIIEAVVPRILSALTEHNLIITDE